MRTLEYDRHEFHGEPEPRSADLAVFVYDVPFFAACGIFPPLHIANEIFQSGGSASGMSPGATWQPFQISGGEYDELVRVVGRLDPAGLGDGARYTGVKYAFDQSFDHIPDWETWLLAVCEKHRAAYHRRQGGE